MRVALENGNGTGPFSNETIANTPLEGGEGGGGREREREREGERERERVRGREGGRCYSSLVCYESWADGDS